jgi:hypothetical protein
MAASLLPRIARLEAAMGGGDGADCPTCAARPWSIFSWDSEPARCPQCGASWTRRPWTLRLGPLERRPNA